MANPNVVVLGSGAAGLSAALAAAASGASVTLIERSKKLGGTSAVSGGIAWIPANPYMAAFGANDTVEDALVYLKELCVGDVNWGVVQAFVEDAARVTHDIEERTPITWAALPDTPDYYGEIPGAMKAGRSIWADPLTVGGDVAAMVQQQFDPSLAADRFGFDPNEDEILFLGRAMTGGLYLGTKDLGVDVRTGERALKLTMDGGAVTGVETDQGRYPGRVVIATGGFQFDEGLTRAFLRGPMLAPAGVPTCDGDGLRMALQAQAALGNMAEGHWNTSMQVPGEEFEGAPYARMVMYERANPHSIMVDKNGRRFVNEAQNYGDVGRVLQNFYSPDYAFSSTPAWLIFDGTFREQYVMGPVRPEDPDPDWLFRAEDLATLASRINVPADALAVTVERFNVGAEAGKDPDYRRGEFAYDRYMGDGGAPHPNLGTISKAPFYAVRLVPGCASTKGGPVVDEWSRVLHRDGGAVRGLYAAGVAAASPFGIACWASGNSLGPALVLGARAGEAATRD